MHYTANCNIHSGLNYLHVKSAETSKLIKCCSLLLEGIKGFRGPLRVNSKMRRLLSSSSKHGAFGSYPLRCGST